MGEAATEAAAQDKSNKPETIVNEAAGPVPHLALIVIVNNGAAFCPPQARPRPQALTTSPACPCAQTSDLEISRVYRGRGPGKGEGDHASC